MQLLQIKMKILNIKLIINNKYMSIYFKYCFKNLIINTRSQNDYNYQKRISKIENKKEKEGKDDELNFSMAKILEQLIKNDSVKSKTIKRITGVINDPKAFEKKNSNQNRIQK